MACIESLIEYLREHNVPFAIQRHSPAFTGREVAAVSHLPALMTAKVVVVAADERLVMIVVPAAYRVDLRRAHAILGARMVRLAEERELAAAFPDCVIGAMPPFGNLYGIPVYVDAKLAAQAQLVFQPGTHTETMTVPFVEFARLTQPHVVEVAGELHELAAPAG